MNSIISTAGDVIMTVIASTIKVLVKVDVDEINPPGLFDGIAFGIRILRHEPIHASIENGRPETPLPKKSFNGPVVPIHASFRPLKANSDTLGYNLLSNFHERLPKLPEQFPVVINLLASFLTQSNVHMLPAATPGAWGRVP